MKMRRILSMVLVIIMLMASVPSFSSALMASENPFTDVNPEAWYYDAVMYAYENKLFSGTSATAFSPDMPMTRGMFVTVMGALDGVDKTKYTTSSFTDVDIDEWYGPYVEWANSYGIVDGYGEKFGPNDPVTREQMAVIMYSYANYKGIKTDDVNINAYNKFGDTDKVSEWAVDALKWISTYEIINGTGAIKGAPQISPDSNATRAQVAQIIKAFNNKNFGGSTPVGSIFLAGNNITEYTIIYADDGANAQKNKTTAEKLASYINTAIGTTLVVKADTEVAALENSKEILIGRTNRENAGYITIDRSSLGDEGFVYGMSGNYLYFASTEKYDSTRFAVQDFAEAQLGFLLCANLTVTVGQKTIEIPSDLCYSELPTMEYRTNYQWKGWDIEYRPGEKANTFCNVVHSISQFNDDRFYDYVTTGKDTWDIYLDNYKNNTPCLSDPDLINRVKVNVKALLATKPNDNLVWVTQDDGLTSLICPKNCETCTAMMRDYGSRSATLIKLCNAVADEIAEDYPQYRIVTLAYSSAFYIPPLAVGKYSGEPIKCADNVIVCIATSETCSSHALDDPNCKNNVNSNVVFNDYFERWCDLSNDIYIWDYTDGDWYVNSPFPVIKKIWENYNYYYRHGVKGMFLQGDSGYDDGTPYGEFCELKTYLVGLLSWDSAMTWEEYSEAVNRALKAYYGYGWTYIREFIDKTEELSSENEWHIWTGNYWKYVITPEQYKEDGNLEYLLGLWDTAYSLADTDFQRLNVKRTSSQIKYIECCMAYEQFQATKSDEDRQKLVDLIEAFGELLTETGMPLPDYYSADIDPNRWRG